MNLTDPIFHDELAARKHLEAIQWPDGPVCPYCGEAKNVVRLGGKAGEKGQVLCRPCRKKFTVMVGSIFERSHVPLNKWLLAFRLMASSKKGISAHQLHRSLDVTYKTAWFMAHRVREAMRPTDKDGLGGANKVIEADETYVGGKAKNRAFKAPPKKEAVVALVERDGRVRSFHVANVTAKNVREVITAQASRKSWLMTDESNVYAKLGREFSGHSAVNHSIEEYVRMGGFVHTNTVENFFSILKRGINGVYHHVSPAHLKRYLGEFDFRYNERAGLGVEDAERTEKAIKGAKGKRLTYRRTYEAAHA